MEASPGTLPWQTGPTGSSAEPRFEEDDRFEALVGHSAGPKTGTKSRSSRESDCE